MSITCGLHSSRLYQGGKCGGDQAPRTLSAGRRGRDFMTSAERGFTGSEEPTGEVAAARVAGALLGVETPRGSPVSTGGRATVPSGPGPFGERSSDRSFQTGPHPRTPTPPLEI